VATVWLTCRVTAEPRSCFEELAREWVLVHHWRCSRNKRKTTQKWLMTRQLAVRGPDLAIEAYAEDL
jgi:hypothetical protein